MIGKQESNKKRRKNMIKIKKSEERKTRNPLITQETKKVI